MNIGFETETIEFKKSTSETKEGIISIASILNKHGKGTLYFGVKDNGDVIGQDIGKDTIRVLSRYISQGISPACWYEINERAAEDGKRFIEVNFSGDSAPYSAHGRFFERFADEDKAISDTELERLFKSRQKDYSLWENDISQSTLDNIDEGFLKSLIRKGNESGRINFEYSDIKTVASKLGLLSSDGIHLNQAGNVLLSSNKPVILKLATFATSKKETFTRLNHFEGNIFECIDEAIRYINESIDWKIEITGDAKRYERPEIPAVATREIVINAFAHGNYSSNTTFEIDVFKDRVSIYSPGLFPLGYKPEDFAFDAEEPVMLNPKIVNVLFKVATIESFGSGFERTFSACDKENVAYSYENTKAGFRFIFYRGHGHSGDQENVHENSYGMTKTEMSVYQSICNNPLAVASSIALEIGKSEKTVYRAIKKMKELNILTREGDDYNGKWIVLKELND